MTTELDSLVYAHLTRMPDSTRKLLESRLGPDVPDAWLRDALMAYLRYFARVFELEKAREEAESALVGELNAATRREASGDDDADITAAEPSWRAGSRSAGIGSWVVVRRRISEPTSGPARRIVGSASRCRAELPRM